MRRHPHRHDPPDLHRRVGLGRLRRREPIVLRPNRRELLASAAGAASALIAACGGKTQDQLGPAYRPAGPVEGLRTNTYARRRVNLHPQLDPKLTTTVYLRLESSSPASSVVAVNGMCTHLGCPTRYVPATERFICPCHGAVFGFDGNSLSDVAPNRLRRLRTAVRNGTVYVGPSIDPPIRIPDYS